MLGKRLTPDVFVAGGGAAGLAAAVAAARTGAQTLLVERHGSLGGMATASLVHSICGLYRIEAGEPIWANTGFPREFARRLIGAGGAHGPERMGRVDVLLTSPPAFARLADILVAETPNLTVRFHTEVGRATDDWELFELNCRGCREAVAPKTVIDATGDGSLADLAGLPFEMESPLLLQRPAFIFGLGGLAPAATARDRRLKIARRITEGVRNKQLSHGALGASFRGSFVSIDLSGTIEYDPTAPECLTALEIEGRAIADDLTRFLRKHVPGFENAHISAFPARVGIRESRRILGQYRLETVDIENGVSFPDAVASASWPIELREAATGPRLRYPRDNRPCDIPLRSLRARDSDHFFMAGRCISCSHGAQASIRVIGTCLATGEAAGIAAALVAKNGECDAEQIRSLVSHGSAEDTEKNMSV